MSIVDNMKKQPTLSFEIFPPKTETGMEKLRGVLEELYRWSPDWISCTYGAGGTAKGRNLDICRAMVEAGQTTPVTHYTCIHHSEADIEADAQEYLDLGVDHMVALRGDFLKGEHETHGAFDHATELIGFLRRKFGDALTIACSGLPEGHVLSTGVGADIDVLRRKQDLGADFVITQLTFDMDQFARWMDGIRDAGVTLPVAVGVMPVLDRDACLRHCLSMNGCAIPRPLARHISKYYDDPVGFRDAGMDYTVEQMEQYLRLGANDLHIYALNKTDAVNEILRRGGRFRQK